MTKVTIDEIVYSVTVAEENVNVTVADATETVQVQIASGASDIQIISAGDGNSLISSTAGVVTTLKTISAGDNITLGDDGDTITISATEDDLSNNTTDDLTEGTNNLYYTDARVQTKLGSISGHIIPDTDNAYDLGSDDYKWRSMYLSGGSLYIDGHKVIGSDETGQIDITTDPDQNLNVQAGGTITMLSDGQVTSLQDNTVNLTNGAGRVNVLGILDVGNQIEIDDLTITQSGIEQTQLNQNLTLKTNGDGFVYIETSDFYVGDVNTSAVKIDENSISRYGGGIVTIDGYTNSADMTTAINTAESNANAYTDTREIAITSAYQAYADQSEADAITTSNSYADTAIANLVDSAPATLDTLNELAAALGDDPNFATTVTNSIATKWTQDNTKISNWDTAYSWGDHSVEGYLTSYTETDPVFLGHVASSITSTEITNWNTSYGWGDHSVEGYLTSYTETDPIFTASPANGITATNITNWNTAYSWGNHADEGYLTSFTETDPTVPAHVKAITTTNISNWNTAYGWGDHSIVGYITDYTVTEADVTQHQAALSITESQISDLDHYTDTDARTAISLVTDNAASMSYNNVTGVFTYNDPTGGGPVASATRIIEEVRNTTGSTIPAGSAVYLDGVSGTTPLIHLAENDTAGSFPAVGIVLSSMNNNSNGEIVTFGEITNFDTTGYASNDVLYLSSTAGQLTNVRPSSESNAVQNIARVMRPNLTNGSIIVMGAGRANDVPNLDHQHVFIGNASGVESRQLTTSDVTEGTNLYYTDARAQAVIDTNTAGFITDYTVTESDVTAHQAALSITESQISDLTHYTNAQAISAVEGEATLDLTGDVTIAQDLDVTGLIKINDGFVLDSFNPYAGFGGATMDTSIMGVGQESGWAGMTIRSRGEHDWGLSGFGIPPEAPRALLALQGGRLDGSDNDDYLNSGDVFSQFMMNPYSGYRTGTEWLTPSAIIEAEATENHSSSGMGTKLVLKTTTNGAFAGAQSSAHTDSEITIQGTTVSTNGTLKLDDDVIITGTTEFQGNLSSNGSQLVVDDAVKIVGTTTIEGSTSTKNTVIGDSTIGPYDLHGVTVNGGDTAWAGISLVETTGGASKPINNFSNPSFSTTVYGGTEAAKTGVESGKRIFSAFALASQDGTTPQFANFRFLSETTEQQSSTARGANFKLETTENGSTTTTVSLVVQGDTLTVNQNGNGKITSGGNLILDDDVQVTGTLDVDGQTNLKGNVTLGDANTDVITATGKLKASNGFKNTVLDTNTANYLANVLGIIETGDQGYISDGNNGSPCMAFYDGSNWKKMHDPANNIANS